MEHWTRLVGDMLEVRASVPAEQYDAFFQLVEHPILALANLYQLYYTVAWNRRLAAANDARANVFADRAEAAFKRDQQIAGEYHALGKGKWDGMMLQTHIGYTSWQQPDKDLMPEVKRVATADKPRDVGFTKPAPDPFGPVAIEASKFSKAQGNAGLTWKVIPNLGGSLGAVTAFPQGRPATSQSDGVHLEYPLGVETPGDTTVAVHLLPTLETTGGVDIRVGVSMDDGPVQTLSMRLTPSPGPPTLQEQHNWEKAVINNDFVLEAKFPGLNAGKHVIKIWRIDDNALVSRLVLRKD
jgi:hypothetical protein